MHWENRRLARSSCPYGTSSTTLKNRIAALSATVASSTAFHSPSNVAAPFSTVFSLHSTLTSNLIPFGPVALPVPFPSTTTPITLTENFFSFPP